MAGKNDLFSIESSSFKSLVKSSNISLEEQLAWWREAVERFSYDYDAVLKCNEEIFALTRKLVDSINSVSDTYIDERNYFGDWEAYGDSALAAFNRIKENNRAFLDEGTITYSEYLENINSAGERLYNGRIDQSKRWLNHEMKYNDMSLEDYIDGLKRMADYTREYFNSGIISYKEYTEGLQNINDNIYDASSRLEVQRQKENAAEYSHWEKDASNWKRMRDTYDDWGDFGDSPVKFYERCIERVKEFYDAGKIGWQQFMDDTFDYQLDLYNAQLAAVDNAISKQRDYLAEVKTSLRAKETALKNSWTESDRRADIADISAQLNLYKYAVTQRGQNKYEELKAQLKQLERAEELSALQRENNKIIENLERRLEIAEANKKGLLSSINSRGIDTNAYVAGILKDTSGMQSFLSSMFSQLISAVKSNTRSNSYTDNSSRTYNIASGALSTSLQAITSVVGASFLYRH